jgi:butyrate kinase
MKYNILTINPGSTSTKIALFENDQKIKQIQIAHPAEIIKKFSSVVVEQLPFRLEAILSNLEQEDIHLHQLHAVAGRGGFVRPIPSGTYLVNDQMVKDLRNPWSEHASNLGGLIAKNIADRVGIPAFIVDPVCVDEMEDIARISGLAGVERKAKWQPLNHKAVARKLAENLQVDYNDANFIIAHMGGGITVGAHQKGKVIDVNNGLDGDGPFSPERTGTLPFGDLITLCFSGKYTQEEVTKLVIGNGGLVSYFQTSDVREIEEKACKEKKAKLILQAMAYQIAKEIGACATVLKGKVDAIALTGGLAHSRMLTENIIERTGFIAPVHLYPGEYEMEALAQGAFRVLSGIEQGGEY